jgi:hypothetical protein
MCFQELQESLLATEQCFGSCNLELPRTLLGEPNYGSNMELQRWIASDNFTYTTAPFSVPTVLVGKRNVELVLGGMDTAVHISFNGKHVLAASNMHRTYLVDVAKLVQVSDRPTGEGAPAFVAAASNTLVAKFTGPVPASLAAEAACVALPEQRGRLCPLANCTCPAPWAGPAPNPLVINGCVREFHPAAVAVAGLEHLFSDWSPPLASFCPQSPVTAPLQPMTTPLQPMTTPLQPMTAFSPGGAHILQH